jgi:hypothetical protein
MSNPIAASAQTMTQTTTQPPVRRFRTLAAAIALAVATIGLPAIHAEARDDRPADPGVRCAAKIAPGEYEFYLPGAKVTDVNGNKWVCGPDGQWFRDYSAAIRAPEIQIQRLQRFQQLQTQFGANSSATLR